MTTLPPNDTSTDIEELRRQRQLDWVASGRDLVVGDAADCPLPPDELMHLDARHPAVRELHDSGLTAEVFRVHARGHDWAVKRARSICKVQGVDGQTSFLNEVQRRSEMTALQRPGLSPTVYASLKQGLIVSPWIAGSRVNDWDETGLRQLFDTGLALLRAGFFEWDFCPGNVLRDDRQVWLFDYGYLYRFDPLRHFNSAGTGLSAPQHHLAERIESRHVFGWLLRLESELGADAALRAFRIEKLIALEAYERLRSTLAADGATPTVLQWLDGLCAGWRTALAGSLSDLYLREGWRSHATDLDDDLKGQTCTPTTLQRADWLLAALRLRHPALAAQRVWPAAEAALDRPALIALYERRRQQAVAFQLPGA
ncbi:hypothetical protein [Rhizobacter sp. OV335]|uniref:hypothetical protein n=1 Tax=Rhizobacter sp. OV335 TaxID=1500264 RepID=UPI00090F8EF7|nr:hypothetical protein [Rhizobacter sp. OV335]SHN20808.1 hypothetical protein SAMN02787076_04060 [Rhizobacter sp. OV335]